MILVKGFGLKTLGKDLRWRLYFRAHWSLEFAADS